MLFPLSIGNKFMEYKYLMLYKLIYEKCVKLISVWLCLCCTGGPGVHFLVLCNDMPCGDIFYQNSYYINTFLSQWGYFSLLLVGYLASEGQGSAFSALVLFPLGEIISSSFPNPNFYPNGFLYFAAKWTLHLGAKGPFKALDGNAAVVILLSRNFLGC